jgi:hypothetical protein
LSGLPHEEIENPYEENTIPREEKENPREEQRNRAWGTENPNVVPGTCAVNSSWAGVDLILISKDLITIRRIVISKAFQGLFPREFSQSFTHPSGRKRYALLNRFDDFISLQVPDAL